MSNKFPPGDYTFVVTKRAFQVGDFGNVTERVTGVVEHEGVRHVIDYFQHMSIPTILHSEPIAEAEAEATPAAEAAQLKQGD